MRKIRIGKDFTIRWSIYRKTADGREAYDLTGMSLILRLQNAYRTEEIKDFSVEENTITWVFRGRDQKSVGSYSLVLIQNNGEDGMMTIDKVAAFQLVAHTYEESGNADGNVTIEDISLVSESAILPYVSANGNGVPIFGSEKEMRDYEAPYGSLASVVEENTYEAKISELYQLPLDEMIGGSDGTNMNTQESLEMLDKLQYVRSVSVTKGMEGLENGDQYMMLLVNPSIVSDIIGSAKGGSIETETAIAKIAMLGLQRSDEGVFSVMAFSGEMIEYEDEESISNIENLTLYDSATGEVNQEAVDKFNESLSDGGYLYVFGIKQLANGGSSEMQDQLFNEDDFALIDSWLTVTTGEVNSRAFIFGNGWEQLDKSVDVDLMLQALWSSLPTKLSQLTNDMNFLTEHQDISHLATKEELEGYATTADLASEISKVEKKIPSVEGLATEQYVNDKVSEIPLVSLDGYATEQYVKDKVSEIPVVSLDGLATEEWVNEQISGINLSGYATKTELTTLTEEILANEEVTAAALNDLNDRKADIAYVTNAIAEAITYSKMSIVVQTSSTIANAISNTCYVIDSASAGDVIISAFNAPTEAVEKYIFMFKGAISLTLPQDVKWANGEIPTIDSSASYELSIVATTIAGVTTYKAVMASFL